MPVSGESILVGGIRSWHQLLLAAWLLLVGLQQILSAYSWQTAHPLRQQAQDYNMLIK
jgi:hypothetical protein